MRKLLVLFLPFLLSACAAVQPAPSTDNRIYPEYRRPEPGAYLLMLPPKGETEDLQPGNEILKKELHRQLQAAGYKLAMLEQNNYNALWSEEIAAVGGIYDPATGALREAQFAQALSSLVRRVSSETKAVLVLRPRLVLRSAQLSGASANWDGQQRRVPVVGGEGGSNSGNTLGLSVELIAFAANGEPAWRTYGGASLPYRVNLYTEKNEVRTDLFDNENELAQAVALTLAPIVSK